MLDDQGSIQQVEDLPSAPHMRNTRSSGSGGVRVGFHLEVPAVGQLATGTGPNVRAARSTNCSPRKSGVIFCWSMPCVRMCNGGASRIGEEHP